LKEEIQIDEETIEESSASVKSILWKIYQLNRQEYLELLRELSNHMFDLASSTRQNDPNDKVKKDIWIKVARAILDAAKTYNKISAIK